MSNWSWRDSELEKAVRRGKDTLPVVFIVDNKGRKLGRFMVNNPSPQNAYQRFSMLSMVSKSGNITGATELTDEGKQALEQWHKDNPRGGHVPNWIVDTAMTVYTFPQFSATKEELHEVFVKLVCAGIHEIEVNRLRRILRK